MWSSLLVQLSLSLITFSATVRQREICPEIKPMVGFELPKWANGTWYQLYYTDEDAMFTNEHFRCVERRPVYDEEAQIILTEMYRVQSNGHPQWAESVTHVTDTPGLFYVNVFNHSTRFDRIEYRIVDTDYQTYGLIAACAMNYRLNKKSFALAIDSRTHVPPKGKVQEAVDYFQRSLGRDVTYTPVCFRDCRARC